MKYNRIILALTFFSIILLVACSNDNQVKEEEIDDVKALVDEYSVGNFTDDHQASITSTELIITENDKSEKVHDLPEDEFFVSIAPFIHETHPCDDHSLTGCQGELVDADFNISIETEDGEVIVDDTFNSGENGFVDFWLPRDDKFLVNIEYDGKTTETELSTFEQDGTCITTMQLS